MVNRCSKFLHFGRKSWGEFEKPTPEVPILGTVCHIDSICGVFQQTLNTDNYCPKQPIFQNTAQCDRSIVMQKLRWEPTPSIRKKAQN